MAMGKIATHQHYFPKFYIDAVGMDVLAEQMPPDWSPGKAIAIMDENGIADGILSISSIPKIKNFVSLVRAATMRRPICVHCTRGVSGLSQDFRSQTSMRVLLRFLMLLMF